MRKVYIDLGTYDGDSIQQFKSGKLLQGISNIDEWEIFAFEPASRFDNTYPHTKKAAWIEDGKSTLSIYGYDDLGSTIIEENVGMGSDKKEEVETFDFSKWLKENFSWEDFIIVKFDIEGAEYFILERMIKDSTYKLVDMLFVEFHDHDMPEIYQERRKKLESLLKIRGWDGSTFEQINYGGFKEL